MEDWAKCSTITESRDSKNFPLTEVPIKQSICPSIKKIKGLGNTRVKYSVILHRSSTNLT